MGALSHRACSGRDPRKLERSIQSSRRQQDLDFVFTVSFDPSPTPTFNNLRTRIVPCCVPGPACPDGRQARAVESLIGVGRDRTYTEAAEAAGMSLGTLYTHLRRVRCNHPKLYAAIRKVREAQLAVRHRNAVANARAHTRAYFRRIRRSQLYLLAGYW